MIRLVPAKTLRGLRGEVARLRTDAAVAKIQAASLREQRDRALAAVQAINRAWLESEVDDMDLQRAIREAVALRQVADNYDALQNIPTEHLEA